MVNQKNCERLPFDIDLSAASGLHPGSCTVRASRWGFLPQETEIDLESGGKSDLSMILTRDRCSRPSCLPD